MYMKSVFLCIALQSTVWNKLTHTWNSEHIYIYVYIDALLYRVQVETNLPNSGILRVLYMHTMQFMYMKPFCALPSTLQLETN